MRLLRHIHIAGLLLLLTIALTSCDKGKERERLDHDLSRVEDFGSESYLSKISPENMAFLAQIVRNTAESTARRRRAVQIIAMQENAEALSNIGLIVRDATLPTAVRLAAISAVSEHFLQHKRALLLPLLQKEKIDERLRAATLRILAN